MPDSLDCSTLIANLAQHFFFTLSFPLEVIININSSIQKTVNT